MGTFFIYYCLPKLFCAVLAVGVVLFLLWANKQKADEVKNMAKWFVIVGLVGMLVLGLLGGKMHGFNGKYGEKYRNMMGGDSAMGEVMDEVVEDVVN
jgi:quinol-cytochrome oxidoreductase complex cytochrome b subunit